MIGLAKDIRLIEDALEYVIELYRELSAENGAPTAGTQNQAVDFILADPALSRSVAEWARRNRTDEATTAPPQRLPYDATYRQVAGFLRRAMETSEFESNIGTDPIDHLRYMGSQGVDLPSSREGHMPSFDIVSRIDLAEVDNAVAGVTREIATRFDFKGSKCSVQRKEGVLTVVADDDLKLKQMHELLKVHMTRRKVEPGALDYKPPEKASGNTIRQTIALRQGVDADLGRQLIREVKDSKLKVQVSIQGEELRVTGKKRDDLQGAIAVIRGLKIEQPLQYVNFRE